MASVTVTYDSADEAATGAACLAAFGSGAVNALVTNWLATHADRLAGDQVKRIVLSAKLNPDIATKLQALVADVAKKP